MKPHRDEITEIDLEAYADGLLDRDPLRKAAVEEHLRRQASDLARVEAHAAQNAAIRAEYDPILAEPVPERLLVALRRREPRLTLVARAAVVVAVAAVSGVTGWAIGSAGAPEAWPVRAFAQLARSMPPPDPAVALTAGPGPGPMRWLSDRITLSLSPPDLTQQGFALVDKRLVAASGQKAVQLTYTRADGRRLSLFLRTRWPEEASAIHIGEDDDVRVAFWLDGPIGYGLAGDLPREEMIAVVAAVRQAVRAEPSPMVPLEPPSSRAAVAEPLPLAPATVPVPVQKATQSGRM